MLLTSLLGDKQARRDLVGSWYYGIWYSLQSLRNKVVFIGFGYGFPSALLEYLDLFKPFVG